MQIEDVNILICDDSILARKQLKDIISTIGNPVFLEGTDGQEAVDLYQAEHPDLVFIDVIMPVKDGNAAIKEIIAYDPDAVIIVVSSVGTQSQLKQAILEGARDFVQKPLNPQHIVNLINHFLEGR